MSLKRLANSLVLMLLGCLLIDEVDLYTGYSEVMLEVLLTRFSNPFNKTTFNQCCDGKKDAPMCTETCDIFFVLRVQTDGLKVSEPSKIISWNSSESISSRNFTSSSGNRNFLSFSFKIHMQESSQFSVLFYDDDSYNRSPNLTNVSSYESVVNFTQPFPSINQHFVHRRNFSKNNISFEILYRLKCAKDYYGKHCEVRCKGRDDVYGHEKCLKNGTLVCMSGWKGPRCVEAICPDGCNNGGSCTKPNVCDCRSGWSGHSCEKCVPRSECLHATCTDPNKCICKDNWTGEFCNTLMDYCSRYHPCKEGICENNNKINFTCHCHSGWSEKKCDKFLCSSSCNLTNAMCATNGNCSCNAGWTGVNCNQCIPSENCTHGYCKRPFECLCHEGWGGKKCSQPVMKSYCRQRNPCQNNGVCIDTAQDVYACNCPRGFTGKHCEREVAEPCPIWCNENHGYCEDNKCRCHSGWQGLNCTECVKNSSCVNGHCRQPFECVCNKNWTGPFCNITINECAQGMNSSLCNPIKEGYNGESVSGTRLLIYIVASLSIVLIIIFVIYLVRRLHRKRLTYDVSHTSVAVNNFAIPSYTLSHDNQQTNGWNNNALHKADYGKYAPSEIVLNAMTLQPSQNSRSMLISNDDVICNEDIISPDSAEYCII